MKTLFHFLVRNLAFSCSLAAFATLILSFVAANLLPIHNTAFSAINGGILQFPFKYCLGTALVFSLFVWVIVRILLSPKPGR